MDAQLRAKLEDELGPPRSSRFGRLREKPVDIELAREMKREGFSLTQIAEHFSVSNETLRLRLKRSA